MKRILAGALLFVLALTAPLFAAQPGQSTFFTGNGDQVFPWVQPVPGVTGYAVKCTASGATPQTCNGWSGLVTTNTLTNALSTDASYVVNDSNAVAGMGAHCDPISYSGTLVTNGIPVITACVVGTGTITVHITNVNATNALNGTLLFGFQLY